MKPALVILAAGAGSRYRGLKQLAPIGPAGETLLEYAVFDAVRSGFGRVVLVVRPDTEGSFRDRLDRGMARHVPTAYVHQRPDDLPVGFERFSARVKPWGTGQAVLAAASEIDGPFAVINADDFYGAGSYSALAEFLCADPPADRLAAVGFPVGETLTAAGPVSRAVLEVDRDGLLLEIVEILEVWRQDERILYRDDSGEQRPLTGNELVSMNMWGCPPALFAELRRRFSSFLDRCGQSEESEFLLPEVVGQLVREGRFGVQVLSGGGEWCGLTFRQDDRRVRRIISSLVEEGRYPEDLWA